MMDLVVTLLLTIVVTLTLVLFAIGPILQVAEKAVINGIAYLVQAPLVLAISYMQRFSN